MSLNRSRFLRAAAGALLIPLPKAAVAKGAVEITETVYRPLSVRRITLHTGPAIHDLSLTLKQHAEIRRRLANVSNAPTAPPRKSAAGASQEG